MTRSAHRLPRAHQSAITSAPFSATLSSSAASTLAFSSASSAACPASTAASACSTCRRFAGVGLGLGWMERLGKGPLGNERRTASMRRWRTQITARVRVRMRHCRRSAGVKVGVGVWGEGMRRQTDLQSFGGR